MTENSENIEQNVEADVKVQQSQKKAEEEITEEEERNTVAEHSKQDIEEGKTEQASKTEEEQKGKESSDEKEEKKEEAAEGKKKKKKKEKSEVEKLKEELERIKRKYKKELEKKNKELEEQKEKYLYLAAELDNARKHFKKQADREIDKSVGKVIERFLPLLESFEKALEIKEKIPQNEITPTIQAFLEGFENIYKNFLDTLKALNVKPIDETGVKFDYQIHEVMMRVENPDLEDNTVVQILQKGYLIGDKVLRPAKVIVSRKPKPPEPPKEEKEKDKQKSESDKKEEEQQKEGDKGQEKEQQTQQTQQTNENKKEESNSKSEDNQN